MAPIIDTLDAKPTFGNWRDVNNIEAYILEGWGEGFMFGALLIMAIITVANMRRGVLLHKMILLELVLAMFHGTFCFMSFEGYGYYLSSTAALLYSSYFTHNVVAWLKIQPFFSGPQPFFSPTYSRWVRWIYLTTLAMTIPPLIFEIYNNFRFFNNFSRLYATVRPYEPLFRDPWWIFSCATLFHVIGKSYNLNIIKLIQTSPRFAIMLGAIFFAIAFTVVDILSTIVKPLSITDGINPYWKMALVFKCLTDNVLLDDFKSVLQRLGAMKTDGTNNSMPNSENNNYNSGKRSLTAKHREGEFPVYSREQQREAGLIGLSEALRDHDIQDEAGENSGRRYERSNAWVNENRVGKLGIKIKRLPKLAFAKSNGKGKES